MSMGMPRCIWRSVSPVKRELVIADLNLNPLQTTEGPLCRATCDWKSAEDLDTSCDIGVHIANMSQCEYMVCRQAALSMIPELLLPLYLPAV